MLSSFICSSADYCGQLAENAEVFMRIMELLGQALRSVRSDESKLIEAMPAVAAQSNTISIKSPVFEDGASIPKTYTADGASVFPTLHWKGVPRESKSLLLVIEDPDAPRPMPFVHGIFYNVPPLLEELPEIAVDPAGITERLAKVGVHMGTNSRFEPAYMAPSPPPGHGPHHYHFQLIALDTLLEFDDVPGIADIKAAIEGHVLAAGELVGTYER